MDDERALREAPPDLLQPVQLLLEQSIQVVESDAVVAAMGQHTKAHKQAACLYE